MGSATTDAACVVLHAHFPQVRHRAFEEAISDVESLEALVADAGVKRYFREAADKIRVRMAADDEEYAG